ncbi:hypothetical protein B0T25DRAFT_513917 [Lasiosphaeria hispida]|uniref:Uncharacterized protein n=1 Tax=Lasiosphaeria hispida TaxID=260671 RepID=A0AAJ0MKS2_9PEZI|nr:hypothetical protein B0T25DRAFT_513917 [Lasiosphaeria hispida]
MLHDIAIKVVKAGVAPGVAPGAAVEVKAGVAPGADNVMVGADGKMLWLGSSFEEAFRNVPALGASLGLQDSDAIGTLGGYLSISTADNVEYMALTCHHVLSGGWRLDWGLAKLMMGRFSLTHIDNDKYFLDEVAGHFPSWCPVAMR